MPEKSKETNEKRVQTTLRGQTRKDFLAELELKGLNEAELLRSITANHYVEKKK